MPIEPESSLLVLGDAAGMKRNILSVTRVPLVASQLPHRRIATSECDLFRCDFYHWDICRHGNRHRAVLILDHECGAAAFLVLVAVRHM